MQALAHSWYDGECCSERDCYPISESEVKITREGYLVGNQTIPYAEARKSLDNGYHVCMVNGRVRCLYTPPRGT